MLMSTTFVGLTELLGAVSLTFNRVTTLGIIKKVVLADELFIT